MSIEIGDQMKKSFLNLVLLLIVIIFGPYLSYAQVYIPINLENCLVTFENVSLDSTGTVYFTPHGTGFIVWDDSLKSIFIISNRHIFGTRDSIVVKINSVDKSNKIIGNRYTCYLSKNGKTLLMNHPDSTIDLAIFAFIFKDSLDLFPLEMKRFKMLKDIKLGDPVLFLGFPLPEAAMGEMNYPIVRQGVVSFISKNDIIPVGTNKCLIESNHILIDGNIMPGNSGSPVLSISSYKSGEMASFIGVISSHLYEDRANSMLRSIGIEQGLDYKLGICIPADRVKELIQYYETYLNNIGLMHSN
jgi:S1-C subfamily serine protease